MSRTERRPRNLGSATASSLCTRFPSVSTSFAIPKLMEPEEWSSGCMLWDALTASSPVRGSRSSRKPRSAANTLTARLMASDNRRSGSLTE